MKAVLRRVLRIGREWELTHSSQLLFQPFIWTVDASSRLTPHSFVLHEHEGAETMIEVDEVDSKSSLNSTPVDIYDGQQVLPLREDCSTNRIALYKFPSVENACVVVDETVFDWRPGLQTRQEGRRSRGLTPQQQLASVDLGDHQRQPESVALERNDLPASTAEDLIRFSGQGLKTLDLRDGL